MNLSPPWDGRVVQAGVAVVERDSPVKGLVEMYLGAGETEALCLLGDLEAAAIPLHDVVLADGAFVHEAADALEALWCGPLGGLRFAGFFGETAIVVGDELAQHGVG